MRAKCKKDGRLASKNKLSRDVLYWGGLSCGIPGRDISPALGRVVGTEG